MLLGIIGAMESEVSALRVQMEGPRETVLAGISYWEGTLMGVPAVLARCGIGKVHAAMCALGMAERFHPDAMLNIGVAGALLPELSVGDVVIASGAVQHDSDTSALGDPVGLVSGLPGVIIPCDERLSLKLKASAEKAGLRAVSAVIATGDQFIASLEKKEWIASAFGAGACDMEGGAVAQVCLEEGIPYAAYRAISDTLMGNGLEYAQNVHVAADAGARLLRAFLPDLD